MCDIDLVLVLNEVADAEDLKEQLPRIKAEIKSKLIRNSRSFNIVSGSLTDSKFLVKFSVEGRQGRIDVDVLPTFKVRGKK